MRVIVTGTDPTSRRGGIAFALPGYFATMEHAGIRYEFIPTHHATASGGKWLWWLRALPRLRRCIRTARRNGEQGFLYSHSGAGVSLFREGIVLALGRLWGAKTVMQLHAPEIDNYLKSRWTLNLFKLAVSRADCLCILTPWWKRRFEEAGIRKRLEIIPNPLPEAWEQKAREAKEVYKDIGGNTSINILTLSRIEPGKGVDLVIETMQWLPDEVKLVVAGNGSQANALRHRTFHLKLDQRVRFIGWVSGDEKQRMIDEANILCQPTQRDAMPMSILEAMANGVPIVALNWGPIGDVVPNGRAGILIDEADPKRLAEAIQRLMDPALRQRMGMEGKRWVLEQFSAERVGVELRKMFDAVAQA